jgi:hypothetical protein
MKQVCDFSDLRSSGGLVTRSSIDCGASLAICPRPVDVFISYRRSTGSQLARSVLYKSSIIYLILFLKKVISYLFLQLMCMLPRTDHYLSCQVIIFFFWVQSQISKFSLVSVHSELVFDQSNTGDLRLSLEHLCHTLVQVSYEENMVSKLIREQDCCTSWAHTYNL